ERRSDARSTTLRARIILDCCGGHRHLHSFPTRRSSDLLADWVLYRDLLQLRLIVNLGGICNVTDLPADCQPEDVTGGDIGPCNRSEEHTSELQSRENLVCRLLLEKKKRQEESGRRARIG